MNNRAGEPPKNHFRSDRCYATNGQWYFVTREGTDVGPYATRATAAQAAARLSRALKGVRDPLVVAKIIREFMFLKGNVVRMP